MRRLTSVQGDGTLSDHGSSTNGDAARGPRISRTDVLLLLALGLLWGSAYVAIREGIVGGASPFLFAGARYAIVAAILGCVAWVRAEPLPDRRASLLSALVGGPFIIGFYGLLLYWGEQFTAGGYASVLSGLAPILTVVFGYFLLRSERMSAMAVGGVAVGFVGMVVLVLPSLWAGAGGNWMGPVAILGAFVVFPLGTVLLRRWSRGPQGTWQLAMQFGVGAGIAGVAVVALPGPERLPLTFTVWGSLLVLVVFASLMGYVVYFRLHHRVGPGGANLVAYLLPLVGVGIGSGLFGEPVTVWEVVGFGVVVVGLTLVFAAQRAPPSTPAAAPEASEPRSPTREQSP